MNKDVKRLIYALSVFAVLFVVFFFGLRVMLHIIDDFKIPKLGGSTSLSSNDSSKADISAPTAIGDGDAQMSAAEQPGGVRITKRYFTTDVLVDKNTTMSIALLLSFFCLFKIMKNYDMHHGLEDLKGEERWIKKRELRRSYTKVKSTEISSLEHAGTPVAYINGAYYIDTACTHTLIIGTTGSGKTQSLVLNAAEIIAKSADKQSVIYNDPKPEIIYKTYKLYQDAGYDIVVLNLRDTNNSSGWNPLTFIITEYVRCKREKKDLSLVSEYVDTMCHMLTDDPQSEPMWPESAKSLLSAMILYCIEKAYELDELNAADIAAGKAERLLDKVTLYSVFQLFSHFGGENAYRQYPDYTMKLNALDELFKKLPINSLASASYTTSRFAESETRASIFATLSNSFDIFGRDQGIAKLTSKNEIDFDRLIENSENGTRPFCIYMIIPDDRPSRHIIASLFINQAYLSLMEHLTRYNKESLTRRVNFILDEFGNLPAISGMDNKITVSRSRNIQWWLFIQDLAQLESGYKKEYKTIRENTPNLIYIYSGNSDTNEHISKLLGSKTLQYKTYNGRLSEELSQSQQFEGIPLKSANQLRRLKRGETIVIPHRQYPIISRFKYFYLRKLPEIRKDTVFASFEDINLVQLMLPLHIFAEQLPSEFNEFKQQILAAENYGTAPSDEPVIDEGANSQYAPSDENPMENSDGEYSELLQRLSSFSSPTMLSEEEIIEEVNRISNGDLAEALKNNNITLARTIVRRLDMKNRLSSEQSVVINQYLNNL